MNKEQADDWFKQLSGMSPKMEHLNRNTDGFSSWGPTRTDFWENLYQAFKARIEAEQRASGVVATEGQ